MLSARLIARPSLLWRGAAPALRPPPLILARTLTTPPIPAPPLIPTPPPEILPIILDPNVEPTFASMGLGSNTPSGLVQCAFEWVHNTVGLPWWGTIVVGTLCVRLLMSPLVVISQRNSANMHNTMPKVQELQQKMSDARQFGDPIACARYAHELSIYMKENKVSPFKNAIVPFAQLPVFLSFFVGLRGMANYPVQSMTYGGLFWFTDLTVPDQYYILPVLTSLTMWLTIEVGTDTARLSNQNVNLMKYVMRAIPLVMLPFTLHFSNAILCYWLSTNIVSLVQVSIFKIPQVRAYLKIPMLLEHEDSNKPKKGIVKNVKDTWKNMKMTREVEGRQRNDEMQFNKAGKGPLVRTFKFDPTKVVSAAAKKSS